ncbi:MAG TPA: hypothetical protein VHB51_01715 [Candidatus Saccharimonadales bacterium]|nr:hypothetical protein [Candidatus Saccharimonadales bacterium]
MPPQAQAMTPGSPAASGNQININPLGHFLQGNKNLLATNLPVALATLIVNFGVSVLMIKIMQSVITHEEFNPTITPGQLIATFIAIVIIDSLITAYFYQVLVRAIVTGSRDENVSLGPIFGFVAKRYFKLFLINLMFGVGFFIAGFILGALDDSVHALFVIGSLALAVAALMLAFRFGFATFVGLDDEEPQSVGWILRRSSQLWHASSGAVVVYVIAGAALCVGIVLAFASVAGPSFLLNIATSAGTSNATGVFLTMLEVVIAITTLAGFSEIYNEARFKVDGGVMPNAPLPVPSPAVAAPVPTPMAAPMPAAPMPAAPATVVPPTPAIPPTPMPQNVIVAAPVTPVAPASPVTPGVAPTVVPPTPAIPPTPQGAQPVAPMANVPPVVVSPNGAQPVMPVTTPEVDIEKPLPPSPTGPVIG